MFVQEKRLNRLHLTQRFLNLVWVGIASLAEHAAADAVLCGMQATPSADTAMFFFQTNHLHFSAEFLGRVRLVGSIASLAGVGTYNYLLKDVPLTKMFFWTAVLGTGLGLTQLILITGMADPLTIDCAHLTSKGDTAYHDDKEIDLSS